MSVTRIATRYAKSLIDLAVDQNKLEVVSNDVHTLRDAAKNRDLYLLLKSPIVHADKKTAVLDALFKGKVDDLTLAYLHLLINKGREGYIPEIAAEFVSQYKTMKGITTVRLITATPVSDAVMNDLRNKILESGVTTATLDIETKVDPELIGGFVLEFDQKRYDASVAHKLEELKNQFSKNLYIKEF
ncbi:MAG TPA: ATP synthase F1 subunit delta [Saprospiraceae bacterium]|nr:ATP synthase F1 subunit delta [Saprospiraceae bacterium]